MVCMPTMYSSKLAQRGLLRRLSRRLSRLMVSKIREQKRFKAEYEAAVKIQAIARGVETRVNYHKILNERARQVSRRTKRQWRS